MIIDENYAKIVKILLFAYLCSELHINSTKNRTIPENRFKSYELFLNSTGVQLATNGEYLASVRLHSLDRNFGDGHICSGIIIAPSVVLTVAQCIFDYKKNKLRHPSQFRIVMGSTNRYNRTSETLIYGVTHIYHPNTFNPHTLHDNIAILMLEWNIPDRQSHIKPISIEKILSFKDIKTELEITAWATTIKQEPIAQLMSFNVSSRYKSVGKVFPITLSPDLHIMRFRNNISSDLCPDYGAPVMINNTLLALSTRNGSCGNPSGLLILTEIRQHIPWILQKIGNGQHQNSSIWGVTAFLLFTLITVNSRNSRKVK